MGILAGDFIDGLSLLVTAAVVFALAAATLWLARIFAEVQRDPAAPGAEGSERPTDDQPVG